MFRRWAGRILVAVLVAAVLYFPVRREMLDFGVIEAASFRSSDDARLILWDDGRYRLDGREGKYAIERFPEAPWISSIRLDTGRRLYVRWETRVYQVEDIQDLTGATVKFVRN